MLRGFAADIGAVGDFHIVLNDLPVQRHLHEFGIGRFLAVRVEARGAEINDQLLPFAGRFAGIDQWGRLAVNGAAVRILPAFSLP